MTSNPRMSSLSPSALLTPTLDSPSPHLSLLLQTEATMERSTQAVAALQTEINRLRHELQTLQVDQKSPDTGDTITVADYLLTRLAQNGVTVRLDPWNTAQSTSLTPLYSIYLGFPEISTSASLTMSRTTPRSNGPAIATNSMQAMLLMVMHVSRRTRLV